MSNPVVKCPKCKGSGQTPIPATLQATWTALNRYGFGVSSYDLAKALKIKPTANMNRLDKLLKLRLATRKKAGREVLYYPVRAEQQKQRRA